MNSVTQLLGAIQQGDSRGAEELLPEVYEELRKLAASRMANEPEGHTLQPTALVHEAWLRLAGTEAKFANRGHFFAAAAEAMRRILIERARRKAAQKRGSNRKRIDLDSIEIAADADDGTLLVVNEAIEQLEKEDPRAAAIVKLRFFGGLTLEEAGRTLGFTERTAKRSWSFARAWLYDAIKSAIQD
jgi:RNA polymerase sigma factor (TIGR02999 family)